MAAPSYRCPPRALLARDLKSSFASGSRDGVGSLSARPRSAAPWGSRADALERKADRQAGRARTPQREPREVAVRRYASSAGVQCPVGGVADADERGAGAGRDDVQRIRSDRGHGARALDDWSGVLNLIHPPVARAEHAPKVGKAPPDQRLFR